MSQVLSLGVQSIILTSGTLSPWTHLYEMRIPFEVRLQNSHVINSSQVSACVVRTGPTQKKLNSTFQNRSTSEYQSELGYTIANFARLVPEGMLIFFPSYSVMEKCLEFWKSRRNKRGVTIWDQICRQKSPFVEPRSSSDFGSVVRTLKRRQLMATVQFSCCMPRKGQRGNRFLRPLRKSCCFDRNAVSPALRPEGSA